MPPSIRLMHRFPRPHSLQHLLSSRAQIRPLSLAPSQAQFYPRKNAQDRESIDTEATEYSKSGTDDGAARQGDAAFDPKQTRPEQEKKTAGKGEEAGNPLEVSPANPEVSKQPDPKKGGAEKSARESEGGRQSGGGNPGGR